MASRLKYTGRARTLAFDGKVYAQPDVYAKDPSAFTGSLENPIPISQELAQRLVDRSNLHSFEYVESGEDMLDALTAPGDKTADKLGVDADALTKADVTKDKK